MGLIDKNKLEQFYESGTDPLDTWADMVYIRAEHIEDVPEVDAAKIAKLCIDIEYIACHIGNITMNDVVYAEAQMIFDKVKKIGKELTGNDD